jgi:hypothetical protein
MKLPWRKKPPVLEGRIGEIITIRGHEFALRTLTWDHGRRTAYFQDMDSWRAEQRWDI